PPAGPRPERSYWRQARQRPPPVPSASRGATASWLNSNVLEDFDLFEHQICRQHAVHQRNRGKAAADLARIRAFQNENDLAAVDAMDLGLRQHLDLAHNRVAAIRKGLDHGA